jgi:hypothetical protein
MGSFGNFTFLALAGFGCTGPSLLNKPTCLSLRFHSSLLPSFFNSVISWVSNVEGNVGSIDGFLATDAAIHGYQVHGAWFRKNLRRNMIVGELLTLCAIDNIFAPSRIGFLSKRQVLPGRINCDIDARLFRSRTNRRMCGKIFHLDGQCLTR